VPFISIDDPADARLEDYRNIPDAELIEQRGIFVAEGRLVVTRLLDDSRFNARSVLITDAARRGMSEVFDGRLHAAPTSVPIYVVPQWVINAITGFNIHRGCLAIGERTPPAEWQDVTANARRLVVIERLANADNVGSIFRHAAAFGVDAVLLDPASTDPLYRKAIRTSMGASLRIPFARLDPWPAVLRELRARGYSLLALTPSAERTLQEVARQAEGEKVALVLGHEGEGLSAGALEACDRRARIPMAPGIDSLNVATACAIALYELQRQPEISPRV
jgi:tRNA G18 (ribose-2'-O)-methylase SpoU